MNKIVGLYIKAKNKYEYLSQAKKSVLWFTFASICQNAISFIVTPFYTRVLTESEYGIYSTFQSWLQIVAIICVFALDRCITVGFMRFGDERKKFLSSIQTLMTLTTLLWIVIVVSFKDIFSIVFGLPLYIIVAMFLQALMNNVMTNWSWYERYEYNYKVLTAVSILTTLIIQGISCASVLLFSNLNRGHVLILSTSVSRIALYGVLYLWTFIKGKSFFEKKIWKFGLKYSIPIIPHALSQIILNSSDRIIVEKLRGSEETAYYSVTYSAAMVLNTIFTAMSTAVQPVYFEKIKEKDLNFISKMTNKLITIVAISSIGISLFAPEVLKILAPASYSVASYIFPAIAASTYFNALYQYFANFESYYEKPQYFSIATTIGAGLNIVLNLLLIPIFGFIAAGYTTLFCYILFAILHYLFMRKVCKEFLNGEKAFDLPYILILSTTVLILSVGVTFLYKFFIIRYMLILLIAVVGYYILIKQKKKCK